MFKGGLVLLLQLTKTELYSSWQNCSNSSSEDYLVVGDVVLYQHV